MLSNEMSYRVKNLFAIAAALTVIASRSADTPKEMARDLTERLVALGQAHELVRPVLGQQKGLHLLATCLLSFSRPTMTKELSAVAFRSLYLRFLSARALLPRWHL